MVKGDERYQYHFYHMVTMGLACGLTHPIEWLVQYDRCIGEPYEMYKEISEFAKLAGCDLLDCVKCGKNSTIEDVNKWIDEFYGPERQKIIHMGV